MEQYHCRGEITDYDIKKDDSMLNIYQETAWCEAEGFRQFIEEKFRSIKVYFRCEKCGCEVFYTNDSTGEYFPERYLLDAPDDYHYFYTIDETAKFVSGVVGHEIEASEDAVKAAVDDFTEEHEDDDLFYSFHKFDVVE